MFPVMGMPGGITAGFNVKSSHAEIGGAVILTDEYPSRNTFDHVGVHFCAANICIVCCFHFISFKTALSCRFGNDLCLNLRAWVGIVNACSCAGFVPDRPAGIGQLLNQPVCFCFQYCQIII